MRIAFGAGAQLQIIAQRATGPVALATDDCLNSAAVNVMRARANWRRKNRRPRPMCVERLNHPDAPETIDGVRTIDVFAAWRRIEHILAAAGKIERTTEISDRR